jgi:hypothetical protein
LFFFELSVFSSSLSFGLKEKNAASDPEIKADTMIRHNKISNEVTPLGVAMLAYAMSSKGIGTMGSSKLIQSN